MAYERLDSTSNIFKQRRLLRMQIMREKRLKPTRVAPKMRTRRGRMNFVDFFV
jgi:hypothetical protein